MSEELSESRKRLLQGAVDAAQSCMANGWLANESVVGEHVAAVFLGVLEPLIRADEREKLRQRAEEIATQFQGWEIVGERDKIFRRVLSVFDEVVSGE
jgi:hypothetical protein